MPFGATPSRWCVYQFHHLGEYSVVSHCARVEGRGTRGRVSAADAVPASAWDRDYLGAAVGAEGTLGTSLAAGDGVGEGCVTGVTGLAAARAATDVLIP
jgi:hypothetical protein